MKALYRFLAWLKTTREENPPACITDPVESPCATTDGKPRKRHRYLGAATCVRCSFPNPDFKETQEVA